MLILQVSINEAMMAQCSPPPEPAKSAFFLLSARNAGRELQQGAGAKVQTDANNWPPISGALSAIRVSFLGHRRRRVRPCRRDRV